MTTDFRKADPQYTGFVPHTASDAIDLFFRFKRRGLMPEHHPETFVWCSRALNAEEGEKFEEWLCAPQGVNEQVEMYTAPDPNVEALRLQLIKEAEARDRVEQMVISEEEDDEKEEPEMMPMPPLVRQDGDSVMVGPGLIPSER